MFWFSEESVQCLITSKETCIMGWVKVQTPKTINILG